MPSNLVKATVWITISEIIFNISGFIIHAVVGQILGPADYGRYGLVVTLTTMVIILIGNGIPTAMAKYLSEIFETKIGLVKIIKKQAIILQSLIIGLITIIFFLTAPLIARILGDPTLTPLFRISTLIIPAFAAASFYFSYFTGLHQFNIQSALKVSRSILKIIFIISLAYFWRVEGSIAGYVVAPAVVFLIAFGIDKLFIDRKIQTDTSRSFANTQNDMSFDWRKLVNYAWQIVVFFLAYELLISIDLYLVKGILRSDYETGIYNASITIGRIPYYLFYALTVILLPVISKTTSQNMREETFRVISHSLRLMVILLTPSVILMSIYAKEIMTLFFSEKYISSAYPMSILVWGVGFLTIYYILCFIMSGAEKVKKPMIISIIALIINTILNYILIKKYGIVGSAIATSIASACAAIIMLYYIWKDFEVFIHYKTLLKIILAGTIIYFISPIFPTGKIIFILSLSILFIFYLLLLYALGEITKQDLFFLKKSILKK